MRTIRKRTTKARRELNFLMRYSALGNMGRSRPRQIWYMGSKEEGNPSRRRQENVGDHTHDLTATVIVAIQSLRLNEPPWNLDLSRAVMYAVFHDKIKECFNGDTPAFRKNGNGHAEVPDRNMKEAKERASYERFKRTLGRNMPWLVDVIDAYDRQADPESRFVYALDKLKADINILQDSGWTNIELGADLPTVDLNKRRRVEGCPIVSTWYEELFKIWLANEEKLFPRRRVSTPEPVA